ncbi:hypothetical protein ACFWNK_30005 [Streptomyces sp. NPDC058417]|uniref:hypothetical protein n=1 Tax=unclassified Streptomyces TaxID=2593676 RepID=UPI003651CD6C
MEQSGTPALLAGTVQDLASGVVSALRGGGHSPVAGDGPDTPDTPDHAAGLRVAAARVLGADLLVADVLRGTRPDATAVALLNRATDLYPPRADAPPAIRWSHWASVRAVRRFTPDASGPADVPPPEHEAVWLTEATWQTLTHRLAVLSALALPDADCAVARAARARPADLARGFVRAVRRRDWQQAAGAARWLTLLDGVPSTLGLETGVDFVELMGGADQRVALSLEAARALRTGALV